MVSHLQSWNTFTPEVENSVHTYFCAQFRTLDQILMDDSYPSIQRVSLCVSAEDMTNVCDMKGDDDLQVFRINEEKLLAWLQRKVMLQYYVIIKTVK